MIVGCSPTMDSFSDCLTDEGFLMYGASWCPICLEQKKLFQNSWSKIPYVECSLSSNAGPRSGQKEICNEEGIQAYPTWIYPDGTKKKGMMSLKELSDLSGCSLPEGTSLQQSSDKDKGWTQK